MPRTKNTPHEVDFFNFWKPFVRIFQTLCISHYRVFRPELVNQRLKLNLLRFLFFVYVLGQTTTINFFLAALSRQTRKLGQYNASPTFIFVNVVTRCSQFASFAVIPYETFFKRHTEQELFETLQHVDDIFKRKLNHVIDYRVHRRRQLTTTWLYFLIITTTMTSSFLLNIPLHSFSATGFSYFAYMLFLWRIRIFQIAFYINAVIELMEELKTVMRRQQQRIKCNPVHWKDIQFARKIYSNIWLLQRLIGNCFGYSMALFVIDSSVQMINSAYWIFLNVVVIKSNHLYTREYSAVDSCGYILLH